MTSARPDLEDQQRAFVANWGEAVWTARDLLAHLLAHRVFLEECDRVYAGVPCRA